MKVPDYSWWASCLRALAVGEVPPSCPERDVPLPGRYHWRKRDGEVVGVAIDPLEDGSGFQVVIARGIRFTLTTAAQAEDWCERTFAYCAENPVSAVEYAAWWNSGEWPPEVAERETELKRRRRARVDAQRRPRKPPTNEVSA